MKKTLFTMLLFATVLSFSSCSKDEDAVKKFFKDGVLQEKKKKYYDHTVYKMNNTINKILYISTIQDTMEDW